MIRNALRQLRHRFNRPFMVMFETTLHCNMKCGYCAIWQNQQPEDRAVRERVFARMDEAADFGVFAWSFSGGEPLMNPNVPDYIDYASRKGFFTSMPTNGLALKKCAEACGKLDQLEVSIDTLDRAKFARRRGIDGLPTILAALDHLLGTVKHHSIQINAAVDLDRMMFDGSQQMIEGGEDRRQPVDSAASGELRPIQRIDGHLELIELAAGLGALLQRQAVGRHRGEEALARGVVDVIGDVGIHQRL